MFFAASIQAAPIDPKVERAPPEAPTPITFPKYDTSQGVDWTTPNSVPDFQGIFAQIRRPTDITQKHIDLLNLDVRQCCSVEELVPCMPDGTSCLPPAPTGQPTYTPESAKIRKDYDNRLSEIRLDNDTAFNSLVTPRPNGIKRPRLAYMRKFWEGLENMSAYWDCSLDDYYESKETVERYVAPHKRKRVDTLQHEPNPWQSTNFANNSKDPKSNGNGASPNLFQTSPGLTLFNGNGSHDGVKQNSPRKDSACLPMDETDDFRTVRSASASPQPRSGLRYKGRRISSGRDMPELFRSDTVRAFVDAATWPFKCTAAPPRSLPLVQFDNLRFPIKQTIVVCRTPNDREKAREAWVEGPMMGVQVRADVDFLTESGEVLEHKSRLDLIREIGGLLQLAQERRREGKTEIKPGVGAWWTTTPRWGGGPGGPCNDESQTKDTVEAIDEMMNATKTRRGGRTRMRKTAALLWKEVRCGSGIWDARTTYQAIGRDPSSKYDEVFMISSLNHHISILRLSVHEAYLDCLVSGQFPVGPNTPAEKDWDRPVLRRSKWFDLFDVEDRVLAFRALWGIMTYATRETEATKPTQMDSCMKNSEEQRQYLGPGSILMKR